jgi:uncharacterized protein
MTPILYCHGFASSPRGHKVTVLREMLEPKGFVIDAPDLNLPSFRWLDFDLMVSTLVERGRAVPPSLLVGSSLGALVVLAAARRGISAPMVLIAPALGFGGRWQERIGTDDPLEVYHHGSDSNELIHRAFFERMHELDLDGAPPHAPVTAIMGTDDESVPFDQVSATWKRWQDSGGLDPDSRLVVIGGGDHSLTDWLPLIADEIVRATRAAP